MSSTARPEFTFDRGEPPDELLALGELPVVDGDRSWPSAVDVDALF